MFKVQKSNKHITIETGNAIYAWDAARGGQLVRLDIKDGKTRRALLDADHPGPNLTLKTPGKTFRIADYPGKFTIEYQEEGYLIFSARVVVEDLFTLEQQYEVFRESVVFCEFRLMVNKDKELRVSDAEMGFDLNLQQPANLRSNYVSRDPYIKQDVTTAHVLSEIHVALDRKEKIQTPQLLPMMGLDIGWDTTRCYSNRIELILEDDSSMGGNMLAPTSTVSQEKSGRWQHRWQLCSQARQTLAAPFFYRNKWSIFVGSARTQAGPQADPVVRNNVLGARVCHVMYPYIYGLRNWPWSSVPIRQTFYQDVQLAKQQPPLSTIDQAAQLGCNVLLIHQFWMKNGGSNGEPMANYTPHDPAWLKAFIKKAHAKGMRVLLYVRGIEQYNLYFDFFEKYLKRDWDGLYMDWATPYAMGFAKSTSRHSSVYNYFMFTRALRQRVGENGVLIGHTMMQAASSYACFDATVTGEFSVLHSGLLAQPDVSTSYGGLGCVGVHLIAGNSPDRAMFSSQRAVAYAAGLGWSNHPFAEPDKDFAQVAAFTKPLWDLINSLASDPVRVYNPSVEPQPFATWSHNDLFPMAYQDEQGNVLVTVANLGDKTLSGKIQLDMARLGLPASAKTQTLEIPQTAAASAKADGRTIVLTDLKPLEFCGILIKNAQAASKRRK